MSNKQSKRDKREAARLAAQRRQRIRWAGLAVAIVLGIGAFVALSGGSAEQAAPVAPVAPEFELQNVSGETVRLSDYRGQPVALTFMHTY